MPFVRRFTRQSSSLAALIICWLLGVGIPTEASAAGLSPNGVTQPTQQARRWQELTLDGGNVTAIAFHPTDEMVVFAGTTTGGIFRSGDAGQTWTEQNSGLSNLSVTDLVINSQNGNELYAATREQVFKSTNGGAGWTSILQEVDIRALAVDPDNGSSLYVATGDRLSEFGALYHSPDAGQSWATLYQVRGVIFDVAVTKTSNKVFIAFVPANSPSQGLPWVYATDIATISWQRACPIEDPERIYSCQVADLYVNPQGGDGVYTIYGQHVYKATIGTDWQLLGELPWFVTPTRIVATSGGDTVYVGSETGIFKSTDHGATWTSVDNSIGNLEIQTLATSPLQDGLLLAGTHGQGVLRSTTAGDSWANTSAGMRTPYVNNLIISGDGQTLYASGYGSGIFRSQDGGQTWSIRNAGLDYLGITTLARHPVEQNTLYLGTEVDYNQVLAYGIYN